MEKKYLLVALLVAVTFAMSACAPAATVTPTAGIEMASPVPTEPLGTPGAEATPGMETPTVAETVSPTPLVESPTP